MASRLEKVAQEIFEKSFKDLTPNQQEFTRLQNTLELRKKYAEKQYGVEIDYELEKPDRITKPFLKRKRKEMGRNREKFIEEYKEENGGSAIPWEQEIYNVIENIKAELLDKPDNVYLCEEIARQLDEFMTYYCGEEEARAFIDNWANNKEIIVSLYGDIKFESGSPDSLGNRPLNAAKSLMEKLFDGVWHFDEEGLERAELNDIENKGSYSSLYQAYALD